MKLWMARLSVGKQEEWKRMVRMDYLVESAEHPEHPTWCIIHTRPNFMLKTL